MCNLQITRPFTVQTPTIRYHRMTHRIKSYEETLYSASTGVGPTDTTSPNPPPPSVTMPLTLFQLHHRPSSLDDAASRRLSFAGALLLSSRRFSFLPVALLPSPGGSPSPHRGLSSPLPRASLLLRWSSPLPPHDGGIVGDARRGGTRWIEKVETMCCAGSLPRRRSPRLPCRGTPDAAARPRRPSASIVADLCRFVDLLPLLLPRFV